MVLVHSIEQFEVVRQAGRRELAVAVDALLANAARVEPTAAEAMASFDADASRLLS
jgi:hypothetical protein